MRIDNEKPVAKSRYFILLFVFLLGLLWLLFLTISIPKFYPMEGPLNALCFYTPTLVILIVLFAIYVVSMGRRIKAHKKFSWKSPIVLAVLVVCVLSFMFFSVFNIFSNIRGPLGYISAEEKEFINQFSFQNDLNRENLSRMDITQINQWGNTTFVNAYCMEDENYAQRISTIREQEQNAFINLTVTYLKEPPQFLMQYYENLFQSYFETAASNLSSAESIQEESFENNGIHFTVCYTENTKDTESLVLLAKTDKLLILYELSEMNSIDREIKGYAVKTVEKVYNNL